MQVNGQPYEHKSGLTLHALLDQLNIAREGVAVRGQR